MKIGTAFSIGILFTLAFGVVLALFLAWPVMLLLGAIASQTGFPIAFGYWTCVCGTIILRLVFPTGASSSS